MAENQMKYLKHGAINKAAWDAYIAASPQRLIYAYSFYLDIISPNWEAIVFEENGQWQCVFPVPVRQKFGFRYISQPYFCQQLGFFSKYKTIDSQQVEIVLNFLQTNFRYCNRLFLNIETASSNQNFETCATHLLDLNRPYATIFKGYSSDRKQNLVRAKNAGWAIESSTDFESLIRLHQSHNEVKAVGNTLPFERYQPYIKAIDDLIKRGLAKVFYTKKEGKIEAGCLFVIAEERIIYLFNAASETGRKQHGRLLIIDEIIKNYSNQNYVFDFEDPTDADSVSAYYASFGGVKESFISLKWSHFPSFLNIFLALRRLVLK
jgi:Acetyltransferase (GNAT) domain